MTRKKKDHATATTSGPMGNPVEMVETGSRVIDAVRKSDELPDAPEVAEALDMWALENDKLDANNKLKADLRRRLSLADAEEVTLCRHWSLRRQGVLYAANVHCDGSAERVQRLCLQVVERRKSPPAQVPEDLRQVRSRKPTTLTVAWKKVKGSHGYMVQCATTPEDPATYSRPSMCKRARFAVPGQVLGAQIWIRVLSLDPSLPDGQSDYSAWVAMTVGAY